jgi:hypothetical protein
LAGLARAAAVRRRGLDVHTGSVAQGLVTGGTRRGATHRAVGATAERAGCGGRRAATAGAVAQDRRRQRSGRAGGRGAAARGARFIAADLTDSGSRRTRIGVGMARIGRCGITHGTLRASTAETAVADRPVATSGSVGDRLASPGRTRIACAAGGMAADPTPAPAPSHTISVLALAIARAGIPVGDCWLAGSRRTVVASSAIRVARAAGLAGRRGRARQRIGARPGRRSASVR